MSVTDEHNYYYYYNVLSPYSYITSHSSTAVKLMITENLITVYSDQQNFNINVLLLCYL